MRESPRQPAALYLYMYLSPNPPTIPSFMFLSPTNYNSHWQPTLFTNPATPAPYHSPPVLQQGSEYPGPPSLSPLPFPPHFPFCLPPPSLPLLPFLFFKSPPPFSPPLPPHQHTSVIHPSLRRRPRRHPISIVSLCPAIPQSMSSVIQRTQYKKNLQ